MAARERRALPLVAHAAGPGRAGPTALGASCGSE
jgi:hypothetical protein